MISRRQLVALFATNLVFWTIIQALFTMLPVYALRLGADPASIGNFLGFAFLAMAVGGCWPGGSPTNFSNAKHCWQRRPC